MKKIKIIILTGGFLTIRVQAVFFKYWKKKKFIDQYLFSNILVTLANAVYPSLTLRHERTGGNLPETIFQIKVELLE